MGDNSVLLCLFAVVAVSLAFFVVGQHPSREYCMFSLPQGSLFIVTAGATMRPYIKDTDTWSHR